jgi:deoxyribodipyrimidine photo-lyase
VAHLLEGLAGAAPRHLDRLPAGADRAALNRLATEPGLRRQWPRPPAGRDRDRRVFDDWAQELVATGYLHNHARMWFASIWIFTLRLPWELGADFFLRHLIDGDPASNTLSWRWVGGLHTPGKTYLATADNIAEHRGPLPARGAGGRGPCPADAAPAPAAPRASGEGWARRRPPCFWSPKRI